MTDAVNPAAEDFGRKYHLGQAPALRELERCVLGCDYGGTSWATRGEVELVAASLGLRSGMRLLEIGAGSGWPGLLLAQTTGCEVVLLDVPLIGLGLARDRAAADGLAARCSVVAGSAGTLPFPDHSFDAISHSDVLCCAAPKLEILRSCRRVARPGAKMGFSVIAVAPSLPPAQRRLAIESGPLQVDAPQGYADMLAATGWQVLERRDVTTQFCESLSASLDAMNARAGELVAALGSEEVLGRVQRQQATLEAARSGLLVRECYVAVANTG